MATKKLNFKYVLHTWTSKGTKSEDYHFVKIESAMSHAKYLVGRGYKVKLSKIKKK